MGLKWAYIHLLRITQMADFDFLETANASRFKISNSIALNSLYIFIGNDVTSYFRSQANRMNVFILGRDFSIMVQPILKKFTVLEIVIQVVHFLLCNLLDISATWPRKWGLKWTYLRLRLT